MQVPGPVNEPRGDDPENPPALPPRESTQRSEVDQDGTQNNALKEGYVDLQTHVQRCEELEQQLEAVTEEWKISARELNELQARDEKPCQVTDSHLIDQAQQLRYAIWNFSIQYFEDKWPDVLTRFRENAAYFPDLEATTPGSSSFDVYLKHPTKRPKVVAAFLWQVLHVHVFDKFFWTGDGMSKNLRELRKFLYPENRPKSLEMTPPRPEAEQAFQLWSTTTTQLVLDAIDSDTSRAQEVEDFLRKRKQWINWRIRDAIGLNPKADDQGITKQLDEILNLTLALDKDISQQVARVEWSYDQRTLAETDFKFDRKTMELDEGDARSAKKVRLVVAPALVKRGRSTGEDFDVERILLKRIVNCE
ncbi:hypothetical protein B0T10DRAFT_564231 [Thelonectria olida]|uniref:Uncharacterized protein n=1 Tax=Thelonectria olida TaxID=1576542 RepID=A0A9P8VXZ7_9HYPO|nr:hypothetical protein B0T10DRAFT_564231 [Thelonectria olida]